MPLNVPSALDIEKTKRVILLLKQDMTVKELDVSPYWKEEWYPDEIAFFEYHCWESEKSSDATLWHHTHQKAVILRELEGDAPENTTIIERLYDGVPKSYQIQFDDGYIDTAIEDELLTSIVGFVRPDYKPNFFQKNK